MRNRSVTIDVPGGEVPATATVSDGATQIGTLAGFSRAGAPLIDIPEEPPRPLVAARSCVHLHAGDVGKQVVVRVSARPGGTIILGVIQPPGRPSPVEITADGETITVQAAQSIVLKCGEASIALSRDGKVVIRGKHVVTHASGVNRIRGGSVQLN